MNSIFTVISIILSIFIKIPVNFSLPFLKLEISDSIILIVSVILGIRSGVYILITVNILRTLFFSTASWIGFIIRSLNIILIFIFYYFFKSKNIIFKYFLIIFGTALFLAIKIPLNYFFWVHIFGISRNVLDILVFKVIVPFNIIKVLSNYFLAIIFIKPIKMLSDKFL
ncbi:MAG: ECF transporter S component [Candidatus Paraimprobicoccus trichonymphae]|uniref:ECF transporter S component n=1 Tax=Candidatus Paraimprobicoccus trichonymphae TaxID=3033793 RepID=A0AA48IHF1_9FIRM|nr:MAG: ECF transporter S component [Candidatus Paraimprobicoccus trichonymphae]